MHNKTIKDEPTSPETFKIENTKIFLTPTSPNEILAILKILYTKDIIM